MRFARRSERKPRHVVFRDKGGYPPIGSKKSLRIERQMPFLPAQGRPGAPWADRGASEGSSKGAGLFFLKMLSQRFLNKGENHDEQKQRH